MRAVRQLGAGWPAAQRLAAPRALAAAAGVAARLAARVTRPSPLPLGAGLRALAPALNARKASSVSEPLQEEYGAQQIQARGRFGAVVDSRRLAPAAAAPPPLPRPIAATPPLPGSPRRCAACAAAHKTLEGPRPSRPPAFPGHRAAARRFFDRARKQSLRPPNRSGRRCWRGWSRCASAPACTSAPPAAAGCTTWCTRCWTMPSTRCRAATRAA
jgi:hypothetical protein